MSDIKTLKQYYIDNPCSLNVENYIAQLEQHNKEMLEMIIEIYGVSLYNEDRGLLPLGKMRNIIKKITGKSIDEVIK